MFHPDLADDPTSRAALETLGIASVDAAAELETLLRGGSTSAWTDSDWTEFWTVVSACRV